ncbi:DUF6362 family protein [Rhodoligotrophos ferricapiens]|uniref:DUF6362 family protein n=1 Tax=Rhodoligotrophos ferricapiens TaxID=3069264 RepID=UPI00315C5798
MNQTAWKQHLEARADGIAETADRIRRAILTMAAIPDPDARFVYSGVTLDYRAVRDVREAYGWDEARARRFRPTPRDIDDLLVIWKALAWLVQKPNGRRDLKLLMARAFDTPWWKLGMIFGRDERTLRRWQDGAVTAVHLHLVSQK